MGKIKVAVASVLTLLLVAAGFILVPGLAQAQGFTVEVGSYTIPDNDGSVQVPVVVDPAGTSLAAVGLTIGYDAGLVSVTACDVEPLRSCNFGDAGTIVIQAVEGDGWAEEFVVATFTLQGIGAEDTAPLTVAVNEAYTVDLTPAVGEGIDGSITVSSRAPAASVAADCAANDGRFQIALDNPMDDPISFTLNADGVAETTTTLQPMTSSNETITGIADGPAVGLTVVADGGFGTLLDTAESVRCDAEVSVSVTCAVGVGTIAVELVNYSGSFASYSVTVANSTKSVSISDGLQTNTTHTAPGDGDIPVVVVRSGSEIYNSPIAVDCSDGAPTPTPVPPTPTPVPPTPTPVPPTPTPVPPTPTPTPGDGIIGADAPIEIMHSVTCLAGNGRVDTNIVNTGAAAAAYRIEFGALSARQRTVAEGDWWRMPITGRPDGNHDVVIKRDGVIVSDTVVTVSCDSSPVVLPTPEVQVVNACRSGNGYVLFQFANNTDAPKAYVIEFEGVNNRSTTAQAYGGGLRAVTGRPNGVYDVLVRIGAVPVAEFTVTVACD